MPLVRSCVEIWEWTTATLLGWLDATLKNSCDMQWQWQSLCFLLFLLRLWLSSLISLCCVYCCWWCSTCVCLFYFEWCLCNKFYYRLLLFNFIIFRTKKNHTNSKITFANFLFYFLQKTNNNNNNVKRVILAFFKLTKILTFNYKREMLYPLLFHKTFTINYK